jgi:hypothetical protein
MPGHIAWNEWSFDWDLQELNGLVLKNVHFRNRKVMHKASLPVIRVKYDDDTGPFNDQLGSDGFAKYTDCNDKYVCSASFEWDATQWLELRCGCHIGAYRLHQVWQLGRDGRIKPLVYSRGIHAAVNHVHHAYWRLDVDIDGREHNDVWVNDGENWGRYTVETAVVKQPGRRWAVVNNRTGRGIWIAPGPNDGHADGFSKADFAIRRYHDSEDEPWPFGCWSGLGYDENEPVADSDIVVWYIAHLFHVAIHEEEGSLGEWHDCGPLLQTGLGLESLKDFFQLVAYKPQDGVRQVMAKAGVSSLRELMGVS